MVIIDYKQRSGAISELSQWISNFILRFCYTAYDRLSLNAKLYAFWRISFRYPVIFVQNEPVLCLIIRRGAVKNRSRTINSIWYFWRFDLNNNLTIEENPLNWLNLSIINATECFRQLMNNWSDN